MRRGCAKLSMKRRKHLLWLIGLVLTFLLALSLVLFLGNWLSKEDNLDNAKADAIVVLAGEPSRAFYAADLYIKGYAPKIFVSRPYRNRTQLLLDSIGIYTPKHEEIYRQVMIKKGVPHGDINFFGKSLFSTVEEVEAVGQLFQSGKCSIIVVTSPYHVRRVRMTFRDVLKKCDVKVVGSKYETYPDKWWTERDAAYSTILEVQKIIFYKTGGRFGQ